jgi:hypothetical protein
MEGFESAMEAQRARSKASREEVDLTAGGGLAELADEVGGAAGRLPGLLPQPQGASPVCPCPRAYG